MMQPDSLFFERQKTIFVEVILPLAIGKTYTYRVPLEFNSAIKVGVRVIVQFGKTKIYSAIISAVHYDPPRLYEAKYLLDVIDDEPIVFEKQFQLWDWMADYYMCTVGEVMQAALPAALKLASETKITLGTIEIDKSLLSDKEFLIIEALEISGELKVNDIVKLLGQKTVFPILRKLFDEKFILISEEVSEKFKPKVKTFVRLGADFSDNTGKEKMLNALNRAPKQQDAVVAFLQLSRNATEISKNDIIEASGCGASAVSSLVEKGFFEVYEKVVSRIGGEEFVVEPDYQLNALQQGAYDEIQNHFETKEVTLLHGVTASGKTQIYIRLIEDILAKGQTALYLLPEIALTAQITARLKLHFGEKLGVYHSKFNDNERVEIWRKVLKEEVQVVIGARSSIFLPFQKLGLIIVDEEHETSYKQFEPSPKYHARDSAIYLGYLHQAKVLLGSATPSIESYYNAKSGKYGFVELLQRFGNVALPEIQVINIAEETRKEKMFSYFSADLLEGIQQAIKNKEQVILFQNRRGHTTIIQCNTCGFVAKCVNCDVSLTYHKTSNLLHCHYCGHSEVPLKICPACGTPHLHSKGFGTERIEEELEILIPEATIGRLDLDSAKGKFGFDRIITGFDEGEFDILIGTQMVAKGLDFGKVTLIGVINADSMINYPDFRAYERAFSLFTQVAGRAGRRDAQGKVILQTNAPNHRVIQQVVHHDYQDMFAVEIKERKNYLYPPFYRLIRIDVKHLDFQKNMASATYLAHQLRAQLGDRVLGPEQPLVSRVRNFYIQTILLKIERNHISISKVKELIKNTLVDFENDKAHSGVRIQIDVDPY